MGYVTTEDGVEIFYKDWGPRDAQVIMFHHGWPLSADDWDAQMLFFLGEGFRVVAHDRRGHGRSAQVWDGHDMDHYADDVAAVVNHLGVQGAVHVGHSTGGGEVIRYVARHGEDRVAKAVLVSAVPPLMVKTERNPGGLPKEVFDGLQKQVATNRAQFYHDLPAGPFYGFNRPGATVSEAVVWNWWRQGMMGSAKAHYDGIVAFSQTDFTADLEGATIPVLVMHGDDDQIVPYADSGPYRRSSSRTGPSRPTRAIRTACRRPTPTRSTPISSRSSAADGGARHARPAHHLDRSPPSAARPMILSRIRCYRAPMTRKHFGTDGIRGKANGVITPDLAMKVAQATGILFQRGDHRHRVVIGKDTRLSGYMIESAMQSGFTSVGMDVLLLGPMPTPAVAMLTRSMRADIGIMISASHNAFEDNGIKLFGPDGFKLSDDIEREIEKLIDGERPIKLAKPEALGRAKRVDDVMARYIEFAKMTLPRHLSLDGLRVVVDCANGAAYKVAPETLWELGAEVFSIGVDPDGFNINRRVGSTAPEALVKKVREMRADIGIALDGDADRVLIVDETGRVVDGDQLMAAVAESWKEDGKLSQPGIVATLMSNLGLERYLATIGLTLARTAVGDRYVLEHMRQHGYNLGGEQSGHIILSDYVTTGDGLVAALQVLAVVKRRGRPVSEVCRRFEPVPQILKNVRFEPGHKVPSDKLAAATAAGEARLGAGGRLVIRPSGTEPVVRVMGEGDDHDLVEQVVDDVCEALRAA